MKSLPVCILYSADDDLARAVTAYVNESVSLHVTTDMRQVESLLAGFGAGVLILDLTHPGGMELAHRSKTSFERTVVIAMGLSRSDPMLEAEGLDLFAVEDVNIDRRRMQATIRRAIAFLGIVEENHALREVAPSPQNASHDYAAVPSVPPPAMPFSDAIRHFDNVDALFQSVVEGVARFAHVSRVGIFSQANRDSTYLFRAGTRCLSGTRELTLSEYDPLVLWLTRHAHAVSRGKLPHIAEVNERIMLTKALDVLGAELILPLHGREGIIGWLFVGHHVTGVPFEQADIENLVSLAEYVSLILDNALLYDEVQVQKTLAETVLHSIPVGIIAADADGIVRWFNQAAGAMLSLGQCDVMNQPAGKVGSQLADLLSRAAQGDTTEAPRIWVDAHSGRTLSAAARPLQSASQCLGAVVLLHDLTREMAFRKKQEQVERTSFWAELAAAMSHEVRNPLVAISTFAQLLPERYEDEEFREKFSVLVAQEIGRLNGMIEQINTFANPPDLSFGPLKVEHILSKAVAAAVRCNPMPSVRVERAIEPGLPELWGDEHALVECFSHLIMNSIEAVSEAENPVIMLRVAGAGNEDPPEMLTISVRDNGRGLPAGLGERVFSPFYTTKARGIGLGLPIVKRTVADHGGSIQVEGSDAGSVITVSLPAKVAQKECHEARFGSR